MKIAVLGDTHFGMRSDKLEFHEYYRRFYEEVFFPYLKENEITEIIQTGDLFDRRKFVNFHSLYLARKYFFDHLRANSIRMMTYIGNHDIPFRNTLEINSMELLLQDYIKDELVTVYNRPATVYVDRVAVDIIPWLCRDNEAQIREHIQFSKAQICFGHFQIKGFEMEQGHVCMEGIERAELDKYEIVISGHFHHRSSDGHIYYVGSPGEMTWADHGDRRGFHIFDTDTRDLKFIENPFHMFHKMIYDDTNLTVDTINALDVSKYKNAYVKVVIESKSNPFMFDLFMTHLNKAEPLDVSVVENFSSVIEEKEPDIEQSDDTVTIINKTIDIMDVEVDKNQLKNVMRDVFVEAHNLETETA